MLLTHGSQRVLVAATMGGMRPGQTWFPLTVDYEERHYAVGRIPGSFFRREGRPTERATLTCRMIDRSIRPLFPKGFLRDVQVVATPLVTPSDNNPSSLALLGASIALEISDIPFHGGLTGVRVGRVDGEFVLNPEYSVLEESDLDLFLSFVDDKVMMIEDQSNEVDEAVMIEAINYGFEATRPLLEFIAKIKAEVGREKLAWTPVVPDPAIPADILDGLAKEYKELFDADLHKAEFQSRWNERSAELAAEHGGEDGEHANQVRDELEAMQKQVLRRTILDEGKRRAGRALNETRGIDMEAGIIPGQHGTGLFQRGETQTLSVLTLGSPGDKQRVDDLSPVTEKRFMHHYNFPPYSVGEARFMRGPGRREVGHGVLVEKALLPVLPAVEDFPYTIRVVTECTSSNGSTSMASTCSACVALLNGGVPLKEPVAGISIGLISEGDTQILLKDIEGVEDFYGDMDFKVAGTRNGITAIQVDFKLYGIPLSWLDDIFTAAKEVRLGLLDLMADEIPEPSALAENAPRISVKKIPRSEISKLIGPGGKMIRSIQEDCGVKIDVNDDEERWGTVFLTAPDGESENCALSRINDLFRKAEVGEVYEDATVTGVRDFGIFVRLFGSTEGMLHISEVGDSRLSTEELERMFSEGDKVTVTVREIRRDGKVSLTMRDLAASRADGGRDHSRGGGRDRGGRGRDRGGRGRRPSR